MIMIFFTFENNLIYSDFNLLSSEKFETHVHWSFMSIIIYVYMNMIVYGKLPKEFNWGFNSLCIGTFNCTLLNCNMLTYSPMHVGIFILNHWIVSRARQNAWNWSLCCFFSFSLILNSEETLNDVRGKHIYMFD